MEIEDAIRAIIQELERATKAHPAFHSAHEGYAVILEELDEPWEKVRKGRSERDPKRMCEEAAQVGAMAMHFMTDLP